jgi:membrane-bound metal-dependent hydrolase YbcI (DUF457 family)
MATPYGHTLVGLSLFNLWFSRDDLSKNKQFWIYGLIILGASLPDLDFIPGLFLGHGGRFHHGYFHSLGMAGLVSLALLFILRVWDGKANFLKLAALAFSLILSHLLLDYLTEAPRGFPFFWPFSDSHFLSPLTLFPRVERDLSKPYFLKQALFCFTVESFLFLPLWAASLGRKALGK